MDLRLNGKKVLITGASKGIGEGLAKGFAEEGCDLHLVARSTEMLASLRQEIVKHHDVRVSIQPLDLSDPNAVEQIAKAAPDCDILINNAGQVPSGSLWDVDEKHWRDGWDLKVFGYIAMVRIYYPLMKQRGGGVIINNIGNGGEVFDPNYVAGVMGNSSLMAFTRAMGGVSLDDNIRVVGVNPGPVNTQRVHNMLRKRANDPSGTTENYDKMMASYPLGRPASVPEVADLIIFLASERSGYTSGTIFTVDGGISSRRSIV